MNNIAYELSLLNSIIANQAKELEALKQKVTELSTLSAPKEHDYSKCWKTKDGTLIPYNQMTDFHLFCAIQKVWATNPHLVPLLWEAQARWNLSVKFTESVKFTDFHSVQKVSDFFTERYFVSPLRWEAIRLAYRNLKAAGVEVALTI
jgi:hypothetical protein